MKKIILLIFAIIMNFTNECQAANTVQVYDGSPMDFFYEYNKAYDVVKQIKNDTTWAYINDFKQVDEDKEYKIYRGLFINKYDIDNYIKVYCNKGGAVSKIKIISHTNEADASAAKYLMTMETYIIERYILGLSVGEMQKLANDLKLSDKEKDAFTGAVFCTAANRYIVKKFDVDEQSAESYYTISAFIE